MAIAPRLAVRAEKTFYFAPMGMISEKQGGERNILRGLFFPARDAKEAMGILSEHNKYAKLREIISQKKLRDKSPNSPQQLRNDDVIDYFTRRKPGSYVFFHTHGDLEHDILHTTISPSWAQVPNPRREPEGEFTPYAEQLLRQQQARQIENMKSAAQLADLRKKFETFVRKEGQIVVFDKATPFNKRNETLGHIMQVRVTEPGTGKNFGTPAIFFVHKDDMPTFNPKDLKPGTVLELPDSALKVRTRTIRLTQLDRDHIGKYLLEREKPKQVK
jgi:hypothetical protein